ncbi:MAG: 4-hydroxyphenylacetate 3-hydroxylase N-terminal domain-containing protein [Candidatus Caldarchaeales archaeon]
MRNPEDYIASVQDGREVYYMGKRVGDIASHPSLRIPLHHAKRMYELRSDPAYRDMLVYEDERFGLISSFFKVPKREQDLVERAETIGALTRACNGIFNITQAIGSDALFALMIITKRLEKEHGKGEYHERLMNYYERVVTRDLALATAQMDVKGDRSKRPHEQPDPDLYLRVVEVNEGGIVVCGAKAHTTQSVVADELFFIPSRAMTEKDQDYCVAFAIPANAKGLKFIVRPLLEVDGYAEKEDAPLSSSNLEAETLTVLDHVFVPWDRVFLFKEWRIAGELANLFATYHRYTAVSYRSVLVDLYLGAARLAAACNGIENAPHVRDDILDIVLYKEIMRMATRMAAMTAVRDPETGILVPNPIYTNIGKLYSNAFFPVVIENLIDIAGGLVSTLPSTAELKNPATRPYVEKFMQGSPRFSGLERFKVMRFVRELAGGPLTGYLLGAMIHAEGSVAASKIALYRDYDFAEAERLARKVAGLSEKERAS